MSLAEGSFGWAAPTGGAANADRTAQLLKGLQHAKNRLDQVLVEDCKFPDLFEQLSNQAEPQNYFFEPYATQWCPQIVKKGSIIPLPPVVAASLDEMKTITLSGLMPEINHAWTSVDNRLFLWNYTKRGKFTMFDFEQVIVAVGLCVTPMEGVFTEKVRHLLVVATAVEVIILAVLYEDNDKNCIRLQRTKLSVSADNCVVRKIICSASGRIFFGGSDGDLYEVLYEQQEQMLPFFSRSCRKISHTGSYLNYLPSFLSGLVTMPGKVISLVIDQERNILYTLHDNAHVMVYDLGVTSKESKAIYSLNLLEGGAKYARDNRRIRVSCPDERIFQSTNMQIVSLCVVPREESAFVTLVAVSSNGIRFYLSVFSRTVYTVGNHIPRSKRPTGLDIVFIRMPPPAISLADAPTYHGTEGMQPGYAPGKSPSKVHTAIHKQGVFLMVDGGKDEQDQLIGIAHDPITSCIPTQSSRKPTIRESISLDSCNGKVVQIEELNESSLSPEIESGSATSAATSRGTLKRSFDEITNGISSIDNDAVPIIGEMTSQYSQTPRHFLCLTNAGVQLFKKVRPIDQLHHTLMQSRSGELKAALAPFVRYFGEVQVCSMLIAIACGVRSDPMIEGDRSSTVNVGVKSDELIYSAAVQAIFECGQIAVNESYSSKVEPSNTRIVMTTEMEMSYQHDGLFMFVCRVLRPLWYPRMLGKLVRVVNKKRSPGNASASSSPPVVRSYDLVHSASLVEQLREILFQLRQLMEGVGPYSVSISSGSVLQQANDVAMMSSNGEVNLAYPSRVAELANRYQKGRSEEQLKREKRVKQEQQSLFFLYELVLRCIEGLSLLQIGIEQRIPVDESVARLSFGELVATADGVAAAKQMIKGIMRGQNENNPLLIRQLREQCPSFFSIADLWHYQGYKSLAMAKVSAPNAKETYLKESLKQFLNSCHMWNTEDSIEVLQRVCDDYAMLGFYQGVVKLSLACAKNFDEPETQEHVVIRSSHSKLRRACFNRILVSLKRLLADSGDKTQRGAGDVNGSSPQSVSGVDAIVNIDEETRTRQVDELLRFAIASESPEFHELLYTWLYENGFADLLTRVRSPFIEVFLKEKDLDLLVRLYMDQQKYLTAARVWWDRAHELNDDELENNPDLSQRQFFISKALGCLKSIDDLQHVEVENGVFSSAMDAVKEVSDVLDVLQLQLRVLNALKQTTIELEVSNALSAEELRQRREALKVLTFRMLDASTLYNQFASKYQMWTECLFIIQTCDSDERDIVASLWSKIVYSLVPSSSSHQEFNVWRREQYETAGLSSQTSFNSTFESGIWIGELQCKLLRLGRALYASGEDARDRTVVFPVEMLASQLERLATWYERVTNQQRNGSSMVDLMLNWVIKLLLDIGVSHGILLGHYEQMFRTQGDQKWVLHISQCIYCLIVLWKQYALSPRATKDALMEFGGACPAIADFCGDLIIELKTTITDDGSEAAFLLDRFRKLQNDVVTFRDSVAGN